MKNILFYFPQEKFSIFINFSLWAKKLQDKKIYRRKTRRNKKNTEMSKLPNSKWKKQSEKKKELRKSGSSHINKRC